MIVQSASVILTPKISHETWCVFEHHMQLAADKPPEVIYINACKLVDVLKMSQARQNTEWQRLTSTGAAVIVHVIASSQDRTAIMRQAMKHARTFTPLPICNLRGFNVTGARRRILCSNGKEYASQTEAASELGISQSAICRHLRGDLAHVGGFVFSHVPNGAPDNSMVMETV